MEATTGTAVSSAGGQNLRGGVPPSRHQRPALLAALGTLGTPEKSLATTQSLAEYATWQQKEVATAAAARNFISCGKKHVLSGFNMSCNDHCRVLGKMNTLRNRRHPSETAKDPIQACSPRP